MEILKPKRLRPGDLIGLVAPASPLADPSRIELATRYLEGLGYRTCTGESITRECGYLAGTDEQRAGDLHVMFADRRVKAIMCIRGGYGSPRLLDLLDYRLIRRYPKIFVGYSDITALHLALWRKARLVSFHGPMPGVDLAGAVDAFSEEMLWRTLTSPQPVTIPIPTALMLGAGCAQGRLLGGNLALIASLVGTPYLPEFSGSLLCIEDISEEPYRVDRMLTQLRHAGILSGCRGVLAGDFTDCTPKDTAKPSQSVEEILQETALRLGRPFLARLPFGHGSAKMTLPLGLRARLDADARTIAFLEPALD